MSVPLEVAMCLASAWAQLYPTDTPTAGKLEAFLYECACVGADTLCNEKELTEQEQD